MKRKDYISWDEYFIGVAKLSGMRSKDPSTQVGACIVTPENKIVGTGYNGMPHRCDDDLMSWGRDGDFLDTKYPYVVHAEANAILNATQSVQGCRIYVCLFPCNECAKLIIQSGITEVIYLDDKYEHLETTIAAKSMLNRANVFIRRINDITMSVTT